jgi:hypothetical protein
MPGNKDINVTDLFGSQPSVAKLERGSIHYYYVMRARGAFVRRIDSAGESPTLPRLNGSVRSP